ncbi:hypothetical protein ILUMI_08228 [Ignelater luminosus]|uniref:Uncharacterized protein n=1 Tax=Ignelater luminosus TaxID=2038154 RepID=A0A8K0GAV0_IGNLU|nr:hypothetical protein ILUMI_08228 [Ignelater luminosus]
MRKFLKHEGCCFYAKLGIVLKKKERRNYHSHGFSKTCPLFEQEGTTLHERETKRSHRFPESSFYGNCKPPLPHKVQKIGMDYVESTETKRKGKKTTKLPNGYWMLCSVMKEEQKATPALVVAMILKEEKMKYVIKENLINEKLMSINIKEGRKCEEYTLIVETRTQAKKIRTVSFFENSQKEIDKNNSKIIIMS